MRLKAAHLPVDTSCGDTRLSESPAGNGPGVSREPRSGRHRWDEGVWVSEPASTAAYLMVDLARHEIWHRWAIRVAGPYRPGREPRAAIRPAPVG